MSTGALACGPVRRLAPAGRRRVGPVMAGLCVVLALCAAISLSLGASGVGPWQMLSRDLGPADTAIVLNIRLPRLCLGAMVGASLAVSGALMQGLFRNPLADPGLVGVSSGAGLGAICAIVLGGALPVGLTAMAGPYLVALFAFFGGLISTLVLYHVATRGGQTSVATMLLAGIVMGALAGALSGIMVYLADDTQLRELTFWSLGSLGGATWVKVWASAPLLLGAIVLAPLCAHGLNAMALGEATARHMGVRVERVKTASIVLVAAGTGAAVAVSGGIGFVGIVVPHILRLLIGPDHRALLPAAALLGAALLIGADTAARLIVAPAELPIGILMALIGAPVFLWILLRRRDGLEI
ncbi:iron ABC transporter permease [Rhodobacteraceae bacterium]|nr:iron ABC transporter permease [Paracoccaceae bacterium]